MMYVLMSETSLTLIHCNTLKFQDEPRPRTDQKSALQHSLFGRYANFPWLVHFSMTFIAYFKHNVKH